jgi:hypothetical protein
MFLPLSPACRTGHERQKHLRLSLLRVLKHYRNGFQDFWCKAKTPAKGEGLGNSKHALFTTRKPVFITLK